MFESACRDTARVLTNLVGRYLRKHRNEQAPKMLEAAELQKIIRKANPQLRAMIYLGLNCGLGNKDCATLRLSHIDLAKKWLSFPRPKTGIQRSCPLWPETVAVLKVAIKVRPKPKAACDRVFITKPGNTWDPKSIGDNPVGKEFAKLLKELKLHRKGLGFYTLRRLSDHRGPHTRQGCSTRDHGARRRCQRYGSGLQPRACGR